MSTTGFELGCDGPSTLVVGVDGSDTASRALYYAVGLARRQHSTVIAVFAVTDPVGYDAAMGAAPYQANIDLAAELAPEIQALAAEYEIDVQFLSIAGDPVTVLTKIAAAHRADAIVLGASKALGHKLFGSIAVRAVRRCRCPVTVVP
ncbi:MAG TPA: universal stress protein [Mycobacteriales bacterium]|jgi:nucleotide-binding universal stress UspA family protein|nr:universal stress protein [Mycobacteriales bacterium]